MAPKAKQAMRPGQGKIGSAMIWVIASVVLAAFYETLVLFVIGMAPTLVALLIDRKKFAARSVAYLNFSGCLPFAIDYWMESSGFDRVFQIIGDPYAMLIIYASAAGWGLYYVTRPFAAAYLLVSADYRERRLRQHQDALVGGWGPEVAGSTPEKSTQSPSPPANRG